MNKGIKLSKGKWLCFLGDDDVFMDADVLEKIVKELQTNIDVVTGKIKYQFTESDSYQIKKNEGVFSPDWSRKLWIKNTIHHQATFYQRVLFVDKQFNTSYKVLADYEFNLQLYKENKTVKIVSNCIAYCNSKGVSKNYNWSLYREEIKLKTNLSSKIYWPLFFVLAFLKYFFKKS